MQTVMGKNMTFFPQRPGGKFENKKNLGKGKKKGEKEERGNLFIIC